MKKFMHFLAKLFPNTATGENPVAVKIFHKVSLIKDFFSRNFVKQNSDWTVCSGNYKIINPKGQVAVCTLTSENIFNPQNSDKVAITGTLITPNLGIEKIILNTISNKNIRYLVICGRDSPIFRAGQALECLFKYGVDKEKRIINASGHFPVLKNISKDNIWHFINQVQLISLKEEKENDIIQERINKLKPNLKPIKPINYTMEKEKFTELKAIGKRVPLDYDKNGFFVISVSVEKGEITVKHYYKDNKPGFMIKGKSAERILLAILNKELVSQMSHAGYLGAELTKAEIAIRLKLKYEQDKSIKIN